MWSELQNLLAAAFSHPEDVAFLQPVEKILLSVSSLRVDNEEWENCLSTCNKAFPIALRCPQLRNQWFQTVHALLSQLSSVPATFSSTTTMTNTISVCLAQLLAHVSEMQSQLNAVNEADKATLTTVGCILVFAAHLSNRYPVALSAAWKLIRNALLCHKRAFLITFSTSMSSFTEPPFAILFNSLFSLIHVAFATLEDAMVQENKRKLAEKTLRLITPILCIFSDCFADLVVRTSQLVLSFRVWSVQVFERSSFFSPCAPTEIDLFLAKCVQRGWQSLLTSSTLELSDRQVLLRALFDGDESVPGEPSSCNHPLGSVLWWLHIFDSLPVLLRGLSEDVSWFCRALNALMCRLPHCHSLAWCTPKSMNNSAASASSSGEMPLSAESSSSPLTPTSSLPTSSFFYTYLYQQCASLLLHALGTGANSLLLWSKVEALLWPHLLGCGQHSTHDDGVLRTHPLVASLSVDLWCTLLSLSDDNVHQRCCLVLLKLLEAITPWLETPLSQDPLIAVHSLQSLLCGLCSFFHRTLAVCSTSSQHALLRRVAAHPHAVLLMPSHLLDILLPSRSHWTEAVTRIVHVLHRFTSRPSSNEQFAVVRELCRLQKLVSSKGVYAKRVDTELRAHVVNALLELCTLYLTSKNPSAPLRLSPRVWQLCTHLLVLCSLDLELPRLVKFLQGVTASASRLSDSDVRAVLLVLPEWGTLQYPSEHIADVAKVMLSAYEVLWSRPADGPLRVSVWESLLALMERGHSALLAALIVNKQSWFSQESTRAVRAFTEVVNSTSSAALPPPTACDALLHHLYARSAYYTSLREENATTPLKLKLNVCSHIALLLPLLNELQHAVRVSTTKENSNENDENNSTESQLPTLLTQSVSLLHKLAQLLRPP